MAEKASKGGGIIVAGLIVTLAAAGGGAGLGFLLPVSAPPPQTKTEAKAEDHAAPAETAHEAAVIVQPLPPIVTNLMAPANTWLRLEASLLIDPEAKGEAEQLAARSSETMMAFIRTVTLAQVEGASGYQHFRNDLFDAVSAITEGKVKAIAIATMVVE